MNAQLLKEQYDAGWWNDNDIAWYVANNGISKEDYKNITGSEYQTQSAND